MQFCGRKVKNIVDSVFYWIIPLHEEMMGLLFEDHEIKDIDNLVMFYLGVDRLFR